MTASNSNNVSHEQSIKVIIDYTIELLKRLQSFTEAPLPSNASKKMKEHIAEINKSTIDALNDLKRPTLRLAYVGATSSGKSTVVNALTGHRIMPMETGEMSAGIVRIHHDSSKEDKMRLHLDGPIQDDKSLSGAKQPWKKIDKDDCKLDSDIYNPLAECMQVYHDKRKEMKNLRAPNAEIWCNTLLGENKELLQLPEGIQLQILDLPGIKEVNDSANLSVVQQTLGKNVLTLVMSYDDTAEERLNGLLEEISNIVTAFNGDTSMLLFVLNKIDRWNLNDGDLDSKVDNLAKKIQKNLNLKSKPDIIRMKAQSLMLPQISLGQTNIKNISEEDSLMYLSESLDKYRLTTIEDRWYRRELDGACSDLYDEISKVRRKDQNAKINLHDGGKLEECIGEIKSIISTDNHSEKILAAAMEESGMNSYLESLRYRIDEHFARLVIQPAIGKLVADTRQYVKEMKGECAINIENNIKELEQLLNNIEQMQKNVERRLIEIKKKIEEEKTIVVKFLSSSIVSDRTHLISYLQGKEAISNAKCQYLNSVYKIFNIVDKDIRDSAASNIQNVIQRFFDGSVTENSLNTNLKQSGVSAYTCNELLPLLEKMKSHFNMHGVSIKWKHNEKNKAEIDMIIDDYQKCLAMFPKVIGEFFLFALQIQSQEFERTLVDAVKKIRQEMVNTIKNGMIDKTIADTIVPEFEYIVNKVDMRFDVTQLLTPTANLSSQEITETITEYRDRTWGEWFWSWLTGTPRYVPCDVEEDYITLSLGDSKGYLNEMAKIIKNAQSTIMQSVGEWFSVSSDRVIKLIIDKTQETLKRYEEICQEKCKEAKDSNHEKQVVWKNYQADLERVMKNDEQERGSILGEINAVIEQGFEAAPADNSSNGKVKMRGQRTLD